MSQRPQAGARIHPRVKVVLEEQAKTDTRSVGYLIEVMAVQYFGSRLAGFIPGEKMPGDDGDES